MAQSTAEDIIQITGLQNRLGGKLVHNDLNLNVKRGEIIAIVGASGCGKTTLLRSILMLHKPTAGSIRVFDTEVLGCSEKEAFRINSRWGVMFQSAALFSSLLVWENVIFPLREFTRLPLSVCKEIALLKIGLSGLELEASSKYPSELSGGMRKRAALARSIALDPELVFLDEPTTGLDPKSASDLDELILHLRESLGLTFVIATHDLDSLWRVPDRVVFLGEGRVLAAKPMRELVQESHPVIREYFSSVRARERNTVQREASRDGH